MRECTQMYFSLRLPTQNQNTILTFQLSLKMRDKTAKVHGLSYERCKDFSYLQNVQPDKAAPVVSNSMGTAGALLEINQPESEGDNSYSRCTPRPSYPWENNSRYPSPRRLGGSQSHFEHFVKCLVTPGIKSWFQWPPTHDLVTWNISFLKEECNKDTDMRQDARKIERKKESFIFRHYEQRLRTYFWKITKFDTAFIWDMTSYSLSVSRINRYLFLPNLLWWRRRVPQKSRYTYTRIYDVTSTTTSTFSHRCENFQSRFNQIRHNNKFEKEILMMKQVNGKGKLEF
jgi:hypothetical protein